MVIDDILHSTEPPCLYVTQATADDLANLVLRLVAVHPGAAVRVVRGRKSRSVAAFFDEVSAALQFPYYFGENWNAFDEMIVDLDWLPAEAYLLVLADADSLLADAEDEDFRILTETLSRARQAWLTPNQYVPRERPPTPFHVVLQCSDADGLAKVTTRLAKVPAAFSSILVPMTDDAKKDTCAGLIDAMARRPGMYVGSPSLSAIGHFLSGFTFGLVNAGRRDPLDGWTRWIELRHGIFHPAWHWTRILLHAYGDDAAAIAALPELYRAFVQDRAKLGTDGIGRALREMLMTRYGECTHEPEETSTSPRL